MPSVLHTVRATVVMAIIVTTSVLFSFDSIPSSALEVAVPFCEGSNLVGAFVTTQVATGHVMTTIALTNVGNKTCELGGYPHLIGLRGAKQFNLRITGHGTYGGNLRPSLLAPRMSGALIIGTGDLCAPSYGVLPPDLSYAGVILVLPKDKGTVRVTDVSFNTACWLNVSQLGWRMNFSIRFV